VTDDRESVETKSVGEVDNVLCESHRGPVAHRFRVGEAGIARTTQIRHQHTETGRHQRIYHRRPPACSVRPAVHDDQRRRCLIPVVGIGDLEYSGAQHRHGSDRNGRSSQPRRPPHNRIACCTFGSRLPASGPPCGQMAP